MDLAHFGLRARPFRTSPDRDAYYPATGHESALARVQHALASEEGVALLVSEPGVGKTLLGHRLVELLDARNRTAFLTHTHATDRTSLLQAILFDLGLPYEGASEQELRLRLTAHILDQFQTGEPLLLVIDEAHHLSADLLEELRLLGNLEASRGKAVQIVLLAQPVIMETLATPALASLRQRLTTRIRLEVLDLHETRDYILAQIRSGGGRPQSIISEEAIELIARAAGGVPRCINQIAYQAFVSAFEAGVKLVDAEVVLETLDTLGLEVEDGEPVLDDAAPARTAYLLQEPGQPARIVYGAA